MTDQLPLWRASQHTIDQSNLKQFLEYVASKSQSTFQNYTELHDWSINNYELFWEMILDYFKVEYTGSYDTVSKGQMPNVSWFEGVSLNYAEHILNKLQEDRPAIIGYNEKGKYAIINGQELRNKVAKLANWMKTQGIEKGDTVCAFLPNIPQSVIAFLATCSLGAIWSSCSQDFGVESVIDRFGQIKPKLFFAARSYYYNGKVHDRLVEIQAIQAALQSLKTTVDCNYTSDQPIANSTSLSHIYEISTDTSMRIERVAFSHPIWVLYSSGTTGKPKAITHGQGGMLLEHLKYQHLHNEIIEGDTFFWYSTTGWMMWNYTVGALLCGATIVLYDGSPAYPNMDYLWQMASNERINHFGTSAPFITACMKQGLKVQELGIDLSILKTISSTGSPLPDDAFDYVYQSLNPDVWLCSMSGGTDVCTAFMGGVIMRPIFAGRIQGAALGVDLVAYDDQGNEVIDIMGEMIVRKPMPCMPIYFWGDTDFEKYKESYFEEYEGVWRHGDWITINTDGQIRILGRSDATLNRNGIRIGTADIYAVVLQIKGVADAMVVNVEQQDGSSYMPMFVKLEPNHVKEELYTILSKALKTNCSPRHVPDEYILVDDIPYTISGKKMETPIKKLYMGFASKEVLNENAMRNPEVINLYEQLARNYLSKNI